MTNKNQKGFTLMELFVVVTIIGLMAVCALVATSSSRAKARDANRKSDMAEIQKALEIYYYDEPGQGIYPGDGDLETSRDDTVNNDWSSSSEIWQELVGLGKPFPRRIPKDPINNETYCYRYQPICDIDVCTGRGCCTYLLGCVLEKEGSYVLKGKGGYSN